MSARSSAKIDQLPRSFGARGLTLDVVLQRSPGDEELRRSGETEQCFVELRFRVLESMSLQTTSARATSIAREAYLVNSDVLPLEGAEIESILEGEFVRREQNVEFESLRVSKLLLSNDTTTLSVSDVGDNVEFGRPLSELHLPGGKSRERNDDEERSVLLHFVVEVGKQRAGLNSLPESHLLCNQSSVVIRGGAKRGNEPHRQEFHSPLSTTNKRANSVRRSGSP